MADLLLIAAAVVTGLLGAAALIALDLWLRDRG